jgi:hypothetical protein
MNNNNKIAIVIMNNTTRTKLLLLQGSLAEVKVWTEAEMTEQLHTSVRNPVLPQVQSTLNP